MTELLPAAEGGRVLEVLAAEIRGEHEACERDALSAVEHAIRAGELLLEAKARVRHGEWLPWLGASFPASEDTAANYMRLARNSERVRNSLSIRSALRELAAPKPDGDRPSGLPGLPEPRVLATRAQAEAFTQAVAGWLEDAVDAVRARGPLPPELPLPDLEDHSAMARFWLVCAERAGVAVRRSARRALVLASRSVGDAAAVYARCGAVGLQLADAEPFGPDYERLQAGYGAALAEVRGVTGRGPGEDEVCAVVVAAMGAVQRERAA